MSAEERRLLEPTGLDEGGRRDEEVLTSGVLFRLPGTCAPDILSIANAAARSLSNGKRAETRVTGRYIRLQNTGNNLKLSQSLRAGLTTIFQDPREQCSNSYVKKKQRYSFFRFS